MRSLRHLFSVAVIALTGLCSSNVFAFSQALLDLQRQGLIDLSLPHLPPVAQTPCPNPGTGRDECIMTTEDGRQVIITSPPLVEGCVEGLVRLRGVWVCRAFLTSTAVAILTPPAGVGLGNGGSNGGPGPGGYLGADGQLHVSASDSSPTCDCGRVIGTTTDKDAKDAEKLAEANQAAEKEVAEKAVAEKEIAEKEEAAKATDESTKPTPTEHDDTDHDHDT